MNKKSFIFVLFLLAARIAGAQHILRSDVVYKGDVLQQQYMFVKADSKVVGKDWLTYLSKFGKVTETKGEITVAKIKDAGLGSFVDSAISHVRDEKDFTVVSLLLFDDKGKPLDDKQVKKEGLEKLFYDFYDMAYFNEEVRMAEKDLEYANGLMKVADKDKGKAERNVEANLKAQEKLGKKLSQSPEELSKVIQEKDAIYQELLAKEQQETEGVVAEDKNKLSEKMDEKDKQLVKIKEKSERDGDKLAQREKEFPKLSDELFAARKNLEKAKQVVESKKLVLQELKAKK